LNFKEKIKKDLEIKTILGILSEYCDTDYGKKYFLNNIDFMENISEIEKEYSISRSFFSFYNSGKRLDLKGLPEISEAVLKTENGNSPDIKEYREISDFHSQVNNLFDSCKNDIDENIQSLFMKFSYHRELVEMINKIITKDYEISDKASETLFSIRRNINSLKSKISSSINIYINRYMKYLTLEKPVIKNGKVCLSVSSDSRTRVRGIVVGKSDSGSSYFIQPEELSIFDDELEDYLNREKAEVARLLSMIKFEVYKRINSIKKNIELISYIDHIMGKTLYAVKNYAYFFLPEVKETGIVLKGMKHPLIDEKDVVPLDIEINKNAMIITGPNTGGKTVTLKSVGLSFFLTHAVLPVKCIDLKIPFIKKIYTDIGDEQSITQNLSTFSSHLKNLKTIVEESDENTLVLIDELGTGTDPIEGAALGKAIIKNLLDKKSKIFVTSHLSEIKTYSMEEERLATASMSFDINSLKPTYKILVGVPGASHAIEIAKKMGFDDNIIEQSYKNISEDYIKNEKIFSELSQSFEKLEKERKIILKEKNELIRKKEDYEKKYEIVEKKEIEKLNKDIARTKEELRQLKIELNTIISEIKEARKNNDYEKIKEKISEVDKLKEKVSDLEVEKKPNKKYVIKPNMIVMVPGNMKGKVLNIKNKKAEISLTDSPVKLFYSVDELIPVNDKDKNKKTEEKKVSVYVKKTSMVLPEIDIRGMTVAEAIPEMEKFISDMTLSGFSSGCIIHGKGTGKLSLGIWEYLRSCSIIKSFRIGKENEGGTGVTVVEV